MDMSALPISEREAASSVAEPWQVADGMLVADYATSNMVRGSSWRASLMPPRI